MNRRQLGAGIMLMGAYCWYRPAQAAEIDRPNLVIRTYLATPLHSSDWRAAAGDATAILDETGIQVGWINCSTPPLPERCTQTLKSNEVAIRILRVGTTPARSGPLGESLVDSSRRVGTLATIYLDRVEWLARSGGVGATVVLARAIAHEIGHLILGTAAHSDRGLMRAIWTGAELSHGRPADWRFPREDALKLRQAFERRRTGPESVVARTRDEMASSGRSRK